MKIQRKNNLLVSGVSRFFQNSIEDLDFRRILFNFISEDFGRVRKQPLPSSKSRHWFQLIFMQTFTAHAIRIPIYFTCTLRIPHIFRLPQLSVFRMPFFFVVVSFLIWTVRACYLNFFIYSLFTFSLVWLGLVCLKSEYLESCFFPQSDTMLTNKGVNGLFNIEGTVYLSHTYLLLFFL